MFDLNPEPAETGITPSGLLALAMVCASAVVIVWLVTR